MAKREPTRNVIFRPKEAERRERPWTIAFFAFLILYVCVTFTLDDASPVVAHGIWGVVLVVGLAGFIGTGIVRDLKSRQRCRLVFTIYWTQPKEAIRAFARQERKKMGLAHFWPNICLALIFSCLLALSCLGSWWTSRVDPSKHAIPLPWALVCILFGGITGGAFPYLAELLYMLDPPETIGFDSQWMGYLKGRPYKSLWPYERIARIRLESLREGEREFRLMVVSLREGREVAFGLSEEVDVQRIAGFLAEKGVEVAGI
jgi:hypothetical protein